MLLWIAPLFAKHPVGQTVPPFFVPGRPKGAVRRDRNDQD